MHKKQQVIVIGGGITGLTTAYYLQKQIRLHNLPIEVKLIEKSQHIGGKMKTYRKDGYTIEQGPDSFLERKQSAVRLAKEVGLEHDLVNNATGQSYVLVNNQLHPIPGGSIMGIPSKIYPFVTSKLFTFPGKIRAAGDFVLPKSKPMEDQSLGEFFERRLGNEVVENLIEPLLSGIYGGDIYQMSLMATFPQFYKLEQTYGSLIRGTKKTTPSQSPKQPKEKKGSFLAFKSGLENFAETISSKLDPNTILCGCSVDKIIKTDENQYELYLSNGNVLTADSIVMAVNHQFVRSMLSQYSFTECFKDVPSTSVATVSLSFPKEAVENHIDGTGFVVSRNSNYAITACTWLHKKWPHSAPKDRALLRCYVGRPGHEDIVDLSDEEIKQIVLKDLKNAMNIDAKPDLFLITRWKKAMPQYTVGHLSRMQYVESELERNLPGVYLAGCSYRGVGLPDCIDQGIASVNKVFKYLGHPVEV